MNVLLSYLLFHGVALTVLAIITYQDWKNHKFDALIPIAAFIPLGFLADSNTGFPFFLLIGASVYGIYNKYIRPGDILPIGIYAIAFTGIQSIFTLLMVTGLYLYTFPIIRGEKEWIPYLPALLISYLVQLLLL